MASWGARGGRGGEGPKWTLISRSRLVSAGREACSGKGGEVGNEAVLVRERIHNIFFFFWF
ncbi:hypothetical protein BRADI_2g47474v3 [Brachypodium distachyon]|uniref:Uncharacterized protein n=1 Tax=Brachypodium distachyon TaxID=15368 RepID=A0A2K2DEJ5_BRADI|nr:hypothetical protein BRADI_2g47474v3 [Brachypodium distachyon]